MARKSQQTQEQANREILAALPPEVLRERQRIVDAAVRAARNSSYCDTFNAMIGLVLPEFMVQIDGYSVALDSDGGCCASRSSNQTAWAYYLGEPDDVVAGFDENGYGPNGYDRDGFDGCGYDAEGFDVNNLGRARSRVLRRTPDGNGGHVTERWYSTGYGEYSRRDAAGNLRPGRAATEEEVAEEARIKAEIAAKYADRWNPTAFVPDAVVSPSE